MIIVPNGEKSVLNPQFSDKDRTRMVQECTALIYGSRPLCETLEVHNKTKHCVVRIINETGNRIVIWIENPDDEIFKLEESNVTTPAIG